MSSLQTWYTKPLGRLVAQAEREALDVHLDRFSGARLLQLGAFGDGLRVLRANTSRAWLAGPPGDGPVDCYLEPEALPFQSDSIDAVVLVHSLEFSDSPHQVLREAERVLAPEGHLLVLGFNAWSAWGLARWLRRRGGRAPWNGRYVSASRLRDWLSLLGLEISSQEYRLFRPPIGRPRLQQRLEWLERVGPGLLPWLGGIHITVAQKRVAGITPLRPAWKEKRALIPGGLAQPTSRTRL